MENFKDEVKYKNKIYKEKCKNKTWNWVGIKGLFLIHYDTEAQPVE